MWKVSVGVEKSLKGGKEDGVFLFFLMGICRNESCIVDKKQGLDSRLALENLVTTDPDRKFVTPPTCGNTFRVLLHCTLIVSAQSKVASP